MKKYPAENSDNNDFKSIIEEFKAPGSEFRGAPFWAWNGDLQETELRRQIRIMKKMGLGGFFMHSRSGLTTPYLSEKWFNRIKSTIDEAEKNSLYAWLYDEDRWPSGAAGGFVTKNRQFCQRMLVMKIFTPADFDPAKIDAEFLFAANFSHEKLINYRHLEKKKKVILSKKENHIISFSLKVAEKSGWYNNQGYLDVLNPDAVAEFIRITHDTYQKQIGGKFSRSVPGIFTDEPKMLNPNFDETSTRLPWTGKLGKSFKDWYGYDITKYLPEIFFDLADQPDYRHRYNFFDCLSRLFCDAFGRQIGEWCEKHHLLFTGHLMSEDSLTGQVFNSGSCLRFYEYMQMPGMDQLREQSRIYVTAKQVSSVARQFNRQWRLTETGGCTGWDFPFSGHKALGDWQIALGINFRCQHLAWYSMEGLRKRDYPASISYQSPWYEQYRQVEDYFARINSVMINGREIRDILVIHPNESMWILSKYGYKNDPKVKKLNADFVKLCDFLLSNHLDFDYGDEDLIARYGKTDGNKFVVNQAEYKTILVPPLLTIRSTTLKLIEQFSKNGGKVIFTSPISKLVDAQKSVVAGKVAAKCDKIPFDENKIVMMLDKKCRKVSVTDEYKKEIPTVLYLLREDKNNFYLFINNTSVYPPKNYNIPGQAQAPKMADRTAEFINVTVKLFSDSKGSPFELNPENGNVFSTDSERETDCWSIRTSLAALQSRLYIFPKKNIGKKSFTKFPLFRTVSITKVNKKTYNYSLSDPNVLVLDRALYRFKKEKWNEPEDILKIDQKLRKEKGFAERLSRMPQPWTWKTSKNPTTIPLELCFDFEVKNLPTASIRLAIENPQHFDIKINEHEIDTNMINGWWRDKSLKTLDISPLYLRTGKNKIKLKIDYHENFSGLESIFLLGNFGVELIARQHPVITHLPKNLKIGDWTKQYLPFYSGSVCYRFNTSVQLGKKDRIFIKLPEFRSVAVRLFVNGTDAGIVAWPPFEEDITSFVPLSGKLDVSIEIFGHNRNSHGPLHHANKNLNWVGPAEFVTEGDRWTDKYQLVESGLMEKPQLIIKKGKL